MKLMESLEALVDQHGVTEVLDALSQVCEAKRDHILENWQGTGEEPLAKHWGTAGMTIEVARRRVRELGI